MSSAVAVADTGPPHAPPLERRLQRLRPRLPNDGWWGWGVPLLIAALSFALRLKDISRPSSKVFDEVYYAKDAWSLLHHGVEFDAGKPGFIAHPPLGKWLIAIGEQLFGNTPLGWRFSAAVIGSLSILLIARIARRLFHSTVLGCVAAVLLSLDGLEFVQSRTSMLDIFLMFWVLAAFGCLVIDRDAGRRLVSRRLLDRGDSDAVVRLGFLGARPWRLACGACLGAAAATKWNGGLWIPAFLVLAVCWDAGARRLAGEYRPLATAVLRDGAYAVLPFVVIPAVVYTASWTGWFVSDGVHAYAHDRFVSAGQNWLSHDWAVLHGWFAYHQEMWHFHTHLAAAHPYLSHPLGWLLLARPVAYFYATPLHGCGPHTCSQEVLGIGTPAIWWASIPALLAVAWRMFGRWDWRAAAILVSFVAGYLTWIVDEAQVVPNCHPAEDCHRTMFLFYLLPDVPFMVLAVTMAIGMLLSVRAIRTVGETFGAQGSGPWLGGRLLALPLRTLLAATVTAAYLGAVAWNFSYLYPVLSGQVITYDQWQDRMWFDTCDTTPKRNQHHETAPCWI